MGEQLMARPFSMAPSSDLDGSMALPEEPHLMGALEGTPLDDCLEQLEHGTSPTVPESDGQ